MIITKSLSEEDATYDHWYSIASDILSTARLAEAFHVMPLPGGLLAQDSLFIHYLKKIKEFDGIRSELDQAAQKAQSSSAR